jgi:hypothetical protein
MVIKSFLDYNCPFWFGDAGGRASMLEWLQLFRIRLIILLKKLRRLTQKKGMIDAQAKKHLLVIRHYINLPFFQKEGASISHIGLSYNVDPRDGYRKLAPHVLFELINRGCLNTKRH